MPERTVTVASAQGLHARPASLFVQAAAQSGATVQLTKGDRTVDASSILGVISLGVSHGDEVVLRSEGEGADAALDTLVRFLETDHDAA